MKLFVIIAILFMGISFYSCSVNSRDINRYIDRFERNKNNFENLVGMLKNQDLRVGYSIYENTLPGNIQNTLKELDISNINLNHSQCLDPSYEFMTLWSKKATIHFNKTFCSKEQSTKGYHAKISQMIEVWGLGNGWTMWVDYDFI